jgi:hypothetical protein
MQANVCDSRMVFDFSCVIMMRVICLKAINQLSLFYHSTLNTTFRRNEVSIYSIVQRRIEGPYNYITTEVYTKRIQVKEKYHTFYLHVTDPKKYIVECM